MTIISRLILKHFLVSLVFLSLVLVSGVWLTQSLRFIEIIVNKNVSLSGYFSLVGYLIPDLFATVMPICTLMSLLFTLNKLSADHELPILRNCGLSNWKIARPIVGATLAISIFVAGINIFVVPLSFQSFRDMEFQIRNEFSANFIQEGVFNTMRGLTIYTRSRAPNGELAGVFIHSERPDSSGKQQNPYTIIAQHGIVTHDEQGKMVLNLYHGTRQEENHQTRQISFFHFDRLNYDLQQLAGVLQERVLKPYEKPIFELLYPENAKDLDHRVLSQFRAEAHMRILTPLLVLLFSIIGVATLLTGQYNRRGRFKRILTAVVIAAFTQGALITLINMNGRVPFFIPLSYIIMALIFIGGFIMLENQTIRWHIRKLAST